MTPKPSMSPKPKSSPPPKSSLSTSNSPVLRTIQTHLNLTHNDALFTTLRNSAHTLLHNAGILLSSANDQTVQIRKRQVANELEKLHPEVFGPAVSSRTYEQQKNTSYALLTLTMDVAKRRQKRRRGGVVTPVKEKAPTATATTTTTATVTVRRTTPSPSPPPLPESPTPTPTPVPVLECTPPPPPLPTPLPQPVLAPTPTPMHDLLITLPLDFLGPHEQCRVQFCDLTEPLHPSRPLMHRLHGCLREDGLPWERSDYVVLDMDGMAIRNDRGLRCALGVMAAKGIREAAWRIVRAGTTAAGTAVMESV